jgi:glucose/arabinose dehydrogenase
MNGDTTSNLDKIVLPDGFKIDFYAENVPGARSMTLSDNGILYVGTRDKDNGKVYAVIDEDNDYKADDIKTITSGKYMPNGVAIRNGDLYVAEVDTITRYDDIDNNLDNPNEIVIKDDYPSDRHHGWKYIAFGPDDKLYVPVGAPCNICESDDEIYGTITRINPDGSGYEIYAEGIRNTVGFAWDNLTDELWFTDNGGDWLGDNRPPDELNYAPNIGLHFGYPYCHGSDIIDETYGEEGDCQLYRTPAQELGPHVAALGMKFYTGNMFPEEYHNQIFIAEHGSWNRTVPIGYRVMLVRLDENREPLSYEVFAEGWLQGDSDWGRPVDVLIMPDGSMLVSDDKFGAIYRISYSS